MEREAANNPGQENTAIKTCWLGLPGNLVRLQADERYVIKQQIEELIKIMRCIRILSNPSNEIADLVAKLVEEYEKRKKQLTEDPDKLGNIVKTYLDMEDRNPEERMPLRLMEASNNHTIHTF